ncbi:hypothetical protein [Streptomyces sp. NBC_01304]|uniref:hypothetical protein n=1 Tax=Streptomyces sp. NBC_01304 TaxID=2903818 RepID=UPI002E134EBA|nr:hypothetical protein OG430_37205 [Streptomyces sp. NBC_01304]
MTALSSIEMTGVRPPGVPGPTRPSRPPRPPRRRGRLMLPVAVALLALPLATAAHEARPAPYGDHLTSYARVDDDAAHARVPDQEAHARAGDGRPEPRLRKRGAAVEAYDPATGRPSWTYTREDRRPLALLPAPGHALTLWDDGLVTDTVRADGSAVRWHRAIPAGRAWLATPAARAGTGVLRHLDRDAHMIAVVTPHRISAYRTADGDLRWVLPARRGCAFEPARAVRHGHALIVAQPCTGPKAAWPGDLVAVDGLGHITPHRKPLGNALPGAATRPR